MNSRVAMSRIAIAVPLGLVGFALYVGAVVALGDLVLGAGHLHVIPAERHSVVALEDSVFILTAVTGIEDAAE